MARATSFAMVVLAIMAAFRHGNLEIVIALVGGAIVICLWALDSALRSCNPSIAEPEGEDQHAS